MRLRFCICGNQLEVQSKREHNGKLGRGLTGLVRLRRQVLAPLRFPLDPLYLSVEGGVY